MAWRIRTAVAVLSFLVVGVVSTPAYAGCGCDKPAPVLAPVRPHATYAGTDVTLFHPGLQVGVTYAVTFASGTASATATVEAEAVSRRDLADGVYKPQVVVSLPDLPLGPTSITVTVAGQSEPLSVVDDDAFTVAPLPVSMPLEVGEYHLQDFQAAVARDGTVYLSLDLSQVHHPRTFRVQALGYPLVFMSDDVLFYNIQGFLMQRLGEDMPGLFSIESSNSATDSDILGYSRHEFNTWYLQHYERQPHSLDPADPNWHEDGTRHIDHNYFILAIAGILSDGTLPVPGATPPAELVMTSATFFQHGLVGEKKVKIEEDAVTDSYNSSTGVYGSEGDVASNGKVELKNSAIVNGNITDSRSKLKGDAVVTGDLIKIGEAMEFLPVSIPDILDNLGSVSLSGDEILTLGPGTYEVSKLQLEGNAILHIDNVDGPVTLYTTGDVELKGNGAIFTSDPNPEKFAIYIAKDKKVKIEDAGLLYGLLYGPESPLELKDDAEFFGSLVGHEVNLKDSALVHYDTALRGDGDETSAPSSN